MCYTSPADEELLLSIAEGDSNALLVLHQRYADLVYSMARRVLGNAQSAEEVTQDVFLKLWQKSRCFDPQRGRLSTWLLSIARFAAIDRLRREGRQVVPTLEHADDAAGVLSNLDRADSLAWEQGQQLRLLLDQLPPEQRQVVELAFFAGMTHSELAEYLGVPLGTVKGRLRLGLNKLRAFWFDESTPEPTSVRPPVVVQG